MSTVVAAVLAGGSGAKDSLLFAGAPASRAALFIRGSGLRPFLTWLFMLALVALLSVPLGVFLAAKLVGAWLAVLVLLAGAVGAWLVILLLRESSRGFRDNTSVAQFHGGLIFRHFAKVHVVSWTEVS